MSFLADVLELDEGARLTGIGLRPLAREASHTDGSVYVHVVHLAQGSDAGAPSGAVASFLPSALATIDGNQPDGSTWFGIFQLAVSDQDSLRVMNAADAAIFRALELTAVDTTEIWGQLFRLGALRGAYGDVADVHYWPIADLVTGLIVELTNTDLAEIVASSTTECAELAGERRQESFRRLLDEWATANGSAAT